MSNQSNDLYEDDSIRKLLGIDKSDDEIIRDLLSSFKKNSQSLFANDGLCRTIQLTTYPDKYFVAQEFNDNKDDLRKSIDVALKKFNFISIAANDFYSQSTIICKIAALIQGTPFGVYQLTPTQNRNVYLELGIAFGMEKPFILVKDKNANPAKIVRDIEYYPINSYLSMQYELGNLLENHIASIGRFQSKNSPIESSNKDVVIYHGDVEDVDITATVVKVFKELGFNPVILGTRQEDLTSVLKSYMNLEPRFMETRDQITEAIQTSRLGVFRIHKSASADNFFALGYSIGKNKPTLTIKSVSEEPPSDLLHLSPLSYKGFQHLENQLYDWIKSTVG